MVTELPYPSNSDNEDSASTASTDSGKCHDLVLRDDVGPELPPSFGNIAVTNSTDVHFGNKTFYQGPVTIKQFLYPNDKPVDNNYSEVENSDIVLNVKNIPNGVDNPAFAAENLSQDKCIAPGNSVVERKSKFAKGFQRIQKYSQQNYVVLVTLLAILLASLVILMVVLLLRHPIAINTENIPPSHTASDEQDKDTPVDAPLDPSTNLTLPFKLKIVPRLQWLAQPPVEPAPKLKLPVGYVLIHHTATENCSSQAQCIFQVRHIQTYHIESYHWWDIGYNFLVGGDGEAYEGRGWESEGAHSYGFNYKSIGIAFIGTFNSVMPPARQILTCKRLIQKGVELGYLKSDYKILAARQLQTTQSPGDVLYEEMKKWDHWATEP